MVDVVNKTGQAAVHDYYYYYYKLQYTSDIYSQSAGPYMQLSILFNVLLILAGVYIKMSI